MNCVLKERIILESDLIIKNNYTIRKVSAILKISKSTIHKDLKEKLNKIDKERYKKIKKIMNKHIQERHMNGGLATKEKYLQKGEKNESKGRKINN